MIIINITILNNFAIVSSPQIKILENQDIILNLNGKTINTYSSSIAIINNGKLKITDLSGNGNIISKAMGIIRNNGTLELESGTLSREFSLHSGTRYMILNYGELKITGAKIKSQLSYMIGIANNGTGTIEMSSGSIELTNGISLNGINTTSTGTVTINGGNIKT